MSITPNPSKAPRVSVVIPSWDGHRDGYVPRLLASIEQQSFRDYQVPLIKGISPQGRSINQGVALAQGEILIILDDDSSLADDSVFRRLVDALDTDPTIGMAGASIVLSPEAFDFQRRAALQFPRLNTPVVDVITDSDLACHGGCAFQKYVFEEVGGERENILRGLDPDLRVRLRAAGYRVVLVPNARIYHPLPNGWHPLLRIFFRNGFGSAYAQKFQPENVYDTHELLEATDFQAKRNLTYRILRFPIRLAAALVRGQLMRFMAYSSYALGYAWAWLTAKKIET